MKDVKKSKATKSAKGYVLDSSALLTLWNDEAGADVVEGILHSGEKIHISFMTLMECRYRLWKNISLEESDQFSTYLELLPLEIIWVGPELFEKAIEIKATQNFSVCDSWIIATAIVTGSVLIHKDPEFDQVKDLVTLKALPYKTKK
ncbi:MAG: VapC toxin family PIN domain ribonuclease [Desulfobacca sp.]|nr:VapC toxin family PIN domain ribonuclease [Desulfobacca sp.]